MLSVSKGMSRWVMHYLCLIPAVPFAASLIILSLPNARRGSAAALAVTGQVAALALSVLAFLPTLQTNGFRAVQNFTWFAFGDNALRIGFVLDPLAAAMALMISLVGLCIFVFSIGYMAEDKNFVRFFAYLSFFSGAMLGVVIAGVFLLARVYPLFSLGAVNGVTSSLTVVVWIGVTTALMAALIAIAQADIKRILAYSTVSQLGLMMVSLGVGGVAAGIMHLLAHGFFKALLFLGSGSVIHGCHGEQDIRKMGGLRRLMPVTFMTYAAGMMALSGVPFFFSGGWTKEEILHATAHWPRSHAPYYLILAGVVLTALYMTRQIIYVFFGYTRAAAERSHESPRVMTIPLIVLALCTIFFSVVLTPAWPWLHGFLTGEPVHFDITHLIQPMLFVSLVLVSSGVGVGYWIYRKAGVQNEDRAAEIDPLKYAQPALFRFLANKMWIGELYDRTVIAFSCMGARLSDWMDRYLWDGLVRGFGAIGQLFGIFTTSVDERGINAGVDETTAGARGLGRMMSAAHSGQIQMYLGAVAIGMLALLLLYAWLA